jgi:small-conductance mechanosensitive channel
MSREFSPALTPDVSTPMTAVTTVIPVSPTFDERWEAWQARGAAHDRAVRRKLTIAAPLLAIVAAAIFYALVIR